MSTLLRLSAIALSALLALPAAAAQRTFVASFGLDANNCAITAPCRTFAAAMALTDANGEVIVLDSAGYGAFSISQSVSVIAPPGVYAGVGVFTGDGITVSAGATDTVILRGLHINNQGGSSGIKINSGRSVLIEKCVITGMFDGIRFVPAAPISVVIHETAARHGGTGLVAFTGGATGADSQLRISRSSFSGNSGNGMDISDITRVSISDSVIDGNGVSGMFFFPQAPRQQTRAPPWTGYRSCGT